MKRFLVFSIITFLAAGMVFAEPIKEQRNPAPKTAREQKRENNSVTVEGTLKLEKGLVAVEKDTDNVYVVPMLNRYIGFITGLREGAKVSVEGYEFKKMIHPTKVTIEGKSYDFMSWDNRQAPEAGKRELRPGDRRAPVPYGNNKRNERRNSRDNRRYR